MRALLLVALLGSATAARADDGAAAAKQHYDEGTKAYDLGRYLEAAKEYETAFRIKDAPELLFNIAQAYRLADDHRRAMRSYRAYLRRLPSASNRAEVEAKIAELQKLIEQ
ncbi:MAG TPA: hypothetical protein VFF06_22600, partial [Polyangia bacterium]|nr:hypothetical protein [Polyangia bacterium]